MTGTFTTERFGAGCITHGMLALTEAVRPATTYAEATEAEKHAVLRKVTGSSFLGNFIEWFDYASYSYLATVIAMVFFPAEDRAVAVMSTFGVFALSFLVRPIGAIFWGNMGDKKGAQVGPVGIHSRS